MHTGKWSAHSMVFPPRAQRGAHAVTDSAAKSAYDPDLLYVECRECGKPLVWESGRTRALVAVSGIDVSLLDERCFILSEGCPTCRPGSFDFQMYMVRLAALSSQELLLLHETKGNA